MSGEIWVYLEHYNKKIEEVSLEILGKAGELAKAANMRVVGVILANMLESMGMEAIMYGADTVLFLKHPLFEKYTTDTFTKAITDAILQYNPEILLIGATYQGRDLAARVAARLKTGLTANVVSLKIDNKRVLYSGVPGYGGKIIAEIVSIKNKPQMATVRPGIFKKIEHAHKKGNIVELVPNFENFVSKTKILEQHVQKFIDLSRAERVVIAGNGIESHLELAQKFAELIDANLGATRPLADKGKVSRERQIGSTGYSLNAKITVIFGVSGAEHFVSGIEHCDTVIAVDIDKNSNIFDYSDYCIVADATKLLPVLIKKLERG